LKPHILKSREKRRICGRGRRRGREGEGREGGREEGWKAREEGREGLGMRRFDV